jgi:hypothetical protein
MTDFEHEILVVRAIRDHMRKKFQPNREALTASADAAIVAYSNLEVALAIRESMAELRATLRED